jgi:glycosyltransferase involved in cell wall biosynthesis
MTKILLISRCPPYPIHFGDRLIIWHLARELSQRGYSFDLLALAQFDSDWEIISEYEQFFRSVELFEESKRTVLMYLQRAVWAKQRFPQQARQAWQANIWQAIEERLSTEDYDLVQLFGGVQVYEFAHLLKHIPTVITPYESFSLYLKRAAQQKGNLMAHINRLMARHFENWMYSPYGRTVVLTEEDKSELLGINPKLAIEVIPNGIDLRYFTAEQVEREPATLLFVGNYEYEPNLDAALVLAKQIFPAIQQLLPDVRLQLVGNNPSAALQALQSSAIDVTGRVPDVRPYLARATVFVCPLRIGAGIKNKVLEALAMGIPVVASPISMEGIQAQDGEHVLVSDIESMPQNVLHLLQNPLLQQKLSQNGRPLIETKYSWRSVADSYEALYEQWIK